MAKIELNDICKSFGRNEVIGKLNLHIGDGEFCVFLGPSGCGKSTLLRLIAGLEQATSGSLHIGGREVTRLAPKQRNVAMVFQSYALYPHMTAYENMAFGLKLDRAGAKRDIDRRVRDAARSLHIEDLLHRKPAELSGGQRQRVAIGRAIVRQPEVFLFDEPLSNLDADLRTRMRLEFARLHRRLRTTMVYVTHDQLEAMTLAEQMVVLNEGQVVQAGPPLELYRHPQNLFVGRFLGSPRMNMLPGRLLDATMRSANLVLTNGSRIRVDVDATAARVDDPVTLGIRPEQIRLRGADANRLTGRVSLVEHLGDHALVYVDWAEQAEPMIIQVHDEALPKQNDRIQLGLAPTACHLFDRQGRAFSRTSNSGASMGD